ncbi:MAG TPA: hypothetical protein VFW06_04730 [Acidimicrobiia bacterium]|nr:hypothetical protein [Acidimicrobiia bacterium]
MFESVRDAVEQLRGFARELDPACVDARTAQRLVGLLAEASRLCDGATTRLAARVAETKVWAEHGARSPAEWVAKTTGAPMGEAIGMLETAEHLHNLPATEAALREGLLSPAQAHAVVVGACADPDAEADLLRAAERSSLRGLHERARAVEAAARPDLVETRYRAAHANRDLTTWIDHEGAGRLGWRGTPDSLASIKAALAPHIRRELTAARTAGHDATYGNCASDALVALVTGAAESGSPAGPTSARADGLVKVRVDYSALVRGHTEPGELCEIEGAGPVPVSVVERMAGGHPIVHAVLTKGCDVTRIAHLGRTGSTYLEEALAWRDTRCVVAGCTCSDYLEDHHLVEVANGGISSLATEVRICGYHHDLITYQGYRLVGSHEDGWGIEAPVPALLDSS